MCYDKQKPVIIKYYYHHHYFAFTLLTTVKLIKTNNDKPNSI